MLSELELAALLCSRVCHDLISPISALNNGLEVMEEEDDPEMRDHATKLIIMSAQQASNKLQFARMAYGASGGAASGLDLEEAGRILSALFEKSKIRLDWQAPAQVAEKDFVKIILNLVLVAGDTIPRGGVIAVRVTLAPGEKSLTITASGEKAKIGEDISRALLGQIDGRELDARSIQPFFVHLVSQSSGMKVACHREENQITLTASQK